MIEQILPNNNEKCYRNFSPKNFRSKHALKIKDLSRSSWNEVKSETTTTQQGEGATYTGARNTRKEMMFPAQIKEQENDTRQCVIFSKSSRSIFFIHGVQYRSMHICTQIT
jgi:hypothetical protein